MLIAPGAAETELLTHVTSESALTDYNAWKESMGGLTLDPKHVAETVKFMFDMPQTQHPRSRHRGNTARRLILIVPEYNQKIVSKRIPFRHNLLCFSIIINRAHPHCSK